MYVRSGFGVDMTTVSTAMTTVPTAVAISQNPDALYAAALGSINVSPGIKETLSPIAKNVFDLAYKFAAESTGPSILNELGSAVLSKVSSIIGNDTVQAVQGIAGSVASVVADAMPLIGFAVNMATIAGGIGAATTAARLQYAHAQCLKIMGTSVPGSGSGGKFRPSDIFAPEPTMASLQRTQQYPGWLIPQNPLGIVLAAITEDNSQDFLPSKAPGPEWDDNLHHDSSALAMAQLVYKGLIPADSRVGIPESRRKIYQALRMAIGSHHDPVISGNKIVYPEESLWAIYMDMLTSDFDSGAMTGGYAVYLLEHQFGTSVYGGEATSIMVPVDPDVYNPGGWVSPPKAPCSQDVFIAIVNQVGAMVETWRQSRKTYKPLTDAQITANLAKVRFHFSPSVLACMKVKGKWDTKKNTCTITRAGKPVVTTWNPATKTLIEPMALVVHSAASPFAAVAFGAVVAGTVALIVRAKRRR